MTSKIRVIAVATITAMALVASSTVAAADPTQPGGTFTDDNGSPYEGWIEGLAAAGISTGYGDGTFRPETAVTRAEMAAFLIRALEAAPAQSTGTFTDVPADPWYAESVETLAALGVTAGCDTAPARFCPDEVVSRAEMAVFLHRARGFQDTGLTAAFTDVPPDAWYAVSVSTLVINQVTNGCGEAKFCPADPVTRGQMAAFLGRTFGYPQLTPPPVPAPGVLAVTAAGWIDPDTGTKVGFSEGYGQDVALCGDNSQFTFFVDYSDGVSETALLDVRGSGLVYTDFGLRGTDHALELPGWFAFEVDDDETVWCVFDFYETTPITDETR